MSSGAINNGQITASSEWDGNHAANQGRLFFTRTGIKVGSWSSRRNDGNQWLQIDLGGHHDNVTGVATQGRNDHNQWVAKYKLMYSYDGVNFQYYMGQEEDKVNIMFCAIYVIQKLRIFVEGIAFIKRYVVFFFYFNARLFNIKNNNNRDSQKTLVDTASMFDSVP